MIKIYFDKNLLEPKIKSENFWAFNNDYDVVYRKFFQNRNILINETSQEEAEFIFTPYKWDSNLNKIKDFNNTNIIAFFNDDYEFSMDLPENFTLFRTSANKRMLSKKEKIMPAFCEEVSYCMPLDEIIEKRVISFCGQADHPFRVSAFKEIGKNTSLNKNFIFRKGFWAPEIEDKKLARQQYFDNIKDSLFVLCIRGAGNFSYRLYETLSCGRIPIIINSDLKLPLENVLNWKEFSIIIEKEEIKFLDLIIEEFLENKDIEQLCIQNQIIWDKYLSPHGFIQNIKSYINE
jgi:hypothetical protein